MTTYTKHLSEPWFSLIKLQLKTVEGRLNKGDFSQMKKGDYIIFTNNDFGKDRLIKIKITSIKKYLSFEQYIKKEKLSKCLPSIDTIEEGVEIYHKYYSVKDEEEYGIIAIRFKLVLD